MKENSKKENTDFFESMRVIEEFLFVIEKSTKVIQDIVSNGAILNEYFQNKAERELRNGSESLFVNCKNNFYPNSNTILNGLVKFDVEIMADLSSNTFILDGIKRQIDESLDSNGDLYHLSLEKKSEYLKKKYGSENPIYLTVKDGIPLLKYFQDKELIDSLRKLAIGNKKRLKKDIEVIPRLQNIIKLHQELLMKTTIPNSNIPLEIRLWLKLILEETKEMLDCLTKEEKIGCTVDFRILIVKSLIEASGIGGIPEANKHRFIAEILGTTYDNVHNTVYKKFTKPDMGLEKTEAFDSKLNAAIDVCKFLIDKKPTSEGVDIVSKIIDRMSSIIPRK